MQKPAESQLTEEEWRAGCDAVDFMDSCGPEDEVAPQPEPVRLLDMPSLKDCYTVTVVQKSVDKVRATRKTAAEIAQDAAERAAALKAAENAWLTDPAVIAAPITRPDAEVLAIVAVLSITEAARELGCHPRTLTQWLRAPGRAEAYREAMVDKGLIEGSSSTDPQWLAERLAREQYAPPQKSVEVRQAPPRPVIDVSAFTQEERDQFRALLVKAQQAALSRDGG